MIQGLALEHHPNQPMQNPATSFEDSLETLSPTGPTGVLQDPGMVTEI